MPTQRAGYFTRDGIKRPSVTTVLGRFKDSGGLLTWSYRQGREHGRLEARVQAGLEPAQHVPQSQYETSGKAADIGTLVHAMAEDVVKGRNPQERFNESMRSGDLNAKQLKKVERSFQAFNDWLSMTRIQIVETEVAMISEDLLGGGTLDWIGRMPNGELVIGDIKTSNAIYGDHIVQVAAYRMMWNETHPNQPLIDAAHVCQFEKDHGDFAHRYFVGLENESEYFRLLRKAYTRELEIKRRAR